VFKSKIFFGLPLKVVGNIKESGGLLGLTNPKASADGLEITVLGLGRR
jgi:hypothetical protein